MEDILDMMEQGAGGKRTDTIDMSETREREARLVEAQARLKSEFIGIDGVIDGIVSNIRVWYLFPKMVTKPLVINLWGLTGCGKTSLINRLCELLDISGKTIFYNLAKLDEDSSSELEDNITETLPNRERNPVFVFDEFQFAAAKAEDGKEKDNRTALKTIWEIIDCGVFRAKVGRYTMNHFLEIMFLASYMEKSGVDIAGGRLVGIERVIGAKVEQGGSEKGDGVLTADASTDIRMVVDRYFNYATKDFDDEVDTNYWCDAIDQYVKNKRDVWFSAKTASTLYSMYSLIIDDSVTLPVFEKMLVDMSMGDLVKFLFRLDSKSRGGFCHDYSGALVFVIGNVDEAYTISYDVNPDMDADQFHEITSKLSMVDIKEALQDRFRNEQIARLGNIMFMYPSFSSQNFTDIIRLRLGQYRERVRENFGIDMEFDQSIVDVIYRDGVFPTQGTRPVFSSVYEIVETKLPHIMLKLYDSGGIEGVSSIRMSYGDNKVRVEVAGGNGSQSIEFDQPLRIEDLRRNRKDEQQALTAVHESMHFVMYAKLFGRMPDKLVSNCVSGGANGFMMPSMDDNDFISRKEFLYNIQVCLAGYVAEKYVFGDDEYTSGASADLADATAYASRMVRKYGMCDAVEPCVYTYLRDSISTSEGMFVNSTAIEGVVTREVRTIIKRCEDEVWKTLGDAEWHKMFTKSVKYLFNNVSMPKEVMRQLYDEVSEKKRSEFPRGETYYRDRVKGLNLGEIRRGIQTKI